MLYSYDDIALNKNLQLSIGCFYGDLNIVKKVYHIDNHNIFIPLDYDYISACRHLDVLRYLFSLILNHHLNDILNTIFYTSIRTTNLLTLQYVCSIMKEKKITFPSPFDLGLYRIRKRKDIVIYLINEIYPNFIRVILSIQKIKI